MMRSFNKAADKKLLSPKDGAATLIACAQIRMDSSNLAKITTDPETLNSINFLIYLTRFAIITNWLRLAENSSPMNGRAKAVLETFEEMTLSTMPNEGRSVFAGYIQNLTTSVTELHQIVSTKNVSETDVNGKVLRWCKGWLGNISEDETFLKSTSILWGGAFFAYVHEAMGSLTRSVEAVLFEK
jgi:hypothetical protein